MKFHSDCVSPDLLNLLKQLSMITNLTGFQLGGGTSLALRFGHRRSIDIDLFSRQPFNSLSILEDINSKGLKPDVLNRTEGSLCLSVNNIKVDLLLHTYPLLEKSDAFLHFPLLSLPDLAAMKINAVTNRGSKKDFSDLFLLHQNGLHVKKALEYFCAKYGKAGFFNAVRSLNWFEDTAAEPDPIYANGWDWPCVKREMERICREFVV